MERLLREGVFISFEGGEGAGKTTLIKALAAHLISIGFPILETREPGGTVIGEEIRKWLLHSQSTLSPYTELSLFLASRAEQIQEVIRPALRQKKIVLCDRFNDSTIAYQGGARGLGMEKVSKVCAFICDGLEPHLTFYLDLDPILGLERAHQSRSADRIEAENLAFHIQIRKAYLSLHQKHPKRFFLLDAAKTPKEIYNQALGKLQRFLTDEV